MLSTIDCMRPGDIVDWYDGLAMVLSIVPRTFGYAVTLDFYDFLLLNIHSGRLYEEWYHAGKSVNVRIR